MKCTCGNEKNFSYIEKIFSNGSKHYERWCKDCGAFIQYAPKTEVNPNCYEEENVALFEMPFGKYKGRQLYQIAQEDYKYLIWGVENIKQENIKSRIKIFLTPAKITYSPVEEL